MRLEVSDWQATNANYGSEAQGPDGWRSSPGVLPVVLSAPHAVKHLRDGQPKGGDLRTGGLAEYCAQATGAGFLAANGRQSGDPNWDPNHPYRQELRALAADSVILELHGMSDEHEIDVCLGLGPAPGARERRLAGRLVEVALASGIERVSVNHPFAASPRSITSCLQAEGLLCQQIEISRRLREYDEQSARTLAFLVAAVQAATTV